MSRRELGIAVAALALAGAAALAWRLGGPAAGGGRALRPRPDAVEYAAGAQAIAQEGRYFLQVGARRAPPRYAPGWSLALAPAILAGADARELWRAAALFDVANLLLVGTLALAGVERLARTAGSPGRRRAALATAAAVAALSLGAPVGRWAIARRLYSEPAATFFAVAALALAAAGLFADLRRGRRGAVLAAAGAAGAFAVAIRPADGLAAALAGGALAVAALRVEGARTLARRLAPLAAGGALVAGAVAALLVRSDRLPWQWSAYRFWAPEFYERSGSWLDLAAVVEGGGKFRTSGLSWLLASLAGLPGRRPLNDLVPGLALAAMLALAVATARQQRLSVAAPARALAAAAAVWIASHTLFYAAYVFRYPRFLYAPATLVAGVGALAAGYAMLAGSRGVRLGAFATVAAIAVFAVAGAPDAARAARREALVVDEYGATARAVQAWRRQPPRRRAATTTPFDPVLAQAYGLLPTREAARAAWGALPRTEHVRRLEWPAAAPDSVDTPPGGP